MSEEAMRGFDIQHEADQLLLTNYAPASVVTNADLEILHVRGHTSPYLELASGQASFNLLTMSREALRPSLATAIAQARQQGSAVKHEGTPVTSSGAVYHVTLEVIPLMDPSAGPSFLVLFQETPTFSTQVSSTMSSDGHPGRLSKRGPTVLRIAALEQELAATRTAMQALLEDRDAANEELQTANQELQAINEELITANQELETRNEQLKAAQEYAEAIVEAVREPLVVLTEDLHVERANAAFYQCFVGSPRETEGRSLSELGNGQWNIPRLWTLLEGVLATNQSFHHFEVEHTFPSIGHKIILLNGRRVPWAGTHAPMLLLALEDITEQRRLQQVEQRMHMETEARLDLLQCILDELPSSVYLVRGQDARLVLANRAAADVWGASWPPGQPMDEFLTANGIRIFGVDGRPLVMEQLVTLRAVRQGETARHHQEIIRHPDGTILPVLVNAVVLEASHLLNVPSVPVTGDPSGKGELAAIVVPQDVSALKEAERLKDEFLSVAAHELRTPLAVLKGFADMLLLQTRRGKGPHLADWQVEVLEDIELAVLRLDKLTDDLLDVARLQAGRFTLQRVQTDLVELTRRVVAQRQLTTGRHTLSFHPAMEQVMAYIDSGRIEQVLANLLSNAIKYSPDGGSIEVTIHQEAGTDEVFLSIQDHGIGIPAHEQARLFGRFARAENAYAQGIGGTGLGLYLCRELVEWHGGRIWFTSTEGMGTTFFIALPLASNAAKTIPLFQQQV